MTAMTASVAMILFQPWSPNRTGWLFRGESQLINNPTRNGITVFTVSPNNSLITFLRTVISTVLVGRRLVAESVKFLVLILFFLRSLHSCNIMAFFAVDGDGAAFPLLARSLRPVIRPVPHPVRIVFIAVDNIRE
jgi:hypothetical protein